ADTPDLDGLEVCRELRRHEELAACRVMLVVTGAASRSLLDQMAAAGCDDLVVLPSGGLELCTHVEDLLELPRRRHHRVPVELLAWVEAGARVFQGQTENLSLNGAKVRLDTPLGSVDSVRVRLRREQHEPGIAVDARVVWQREGGRELGLTFIDQTAETRRQLEALVLWDLVEEEGLVRVHLEGDFVETTDLQPLARRLGPRVDFDAAGVRHVNSHGARRWIALLETIDEVHEYTFSRCSPGFTTQACFLPGFLGRGRMVSFMAPYHCDGCDRDETRLLQAAALVPEGAGFVLPRFRCPQCGGSLRFDEIPERYLACLSR
ncbi:MAG: PilZ domain-containing protein, partial [Deltaproteobacteria bacterium]|nr:PilZ domain-containing protein [Deltaproteobacteria bacterium]